MKQIDKYFSDIPKNLGIEGSKTQQFLREIMDNKSVESNHYNRTDVKTVLLEKFGYCCAYCEKRIDKGSAIDHYRPKDVYYWLGAIWSNFVVSCTSCNSAKGKKFDIKGVQSIVPIYKDWEDFLEKTHIEHPTLQDEKPMMLHPALDDWEVFLAFNKNGTVTAIDTDGRGQYLLDTCNISNWEKNQILIEDRKNIVEVIKNDIVKPWEKISSDDELSSQLYSLLLNICDKIEDKTTPFSAVYRTCFNQFDEYIISTFENPFQSRLRKIYQDTIS